MLLPMVLAVAKPMTLVVKSLSPRPTPKRTKESTVPALVLTRLGCRPLPGKTLPGKLLGFTNADLGLHALARRGTGFSSRFGTASQRTASKGEHTAG
jgi:hypothetical protein